MALEVNNPWEAVAYFSLGFHCDDCKVSLEIDSSLEIASDEWCAELARIAYQHEWFINHPDEDGSMDFCTAWCPACGSKRGLVQPAYKTFVAVKK